MSSQSGQFGKAWSGSTVGRAEEQASQKGSKRRVDDVRTEGSRRTVSLGEMSVVAKTPSCVIVAGFGFSWHVACVSSTGSSTARTSHLGAAFLISALRKDMLSSEKRLVSCLFHG